MKKRIFMLALVVGVMLSVCASAWATDQNSIKISALVSGYTAVNRVNDRLNKDFTIVVKTNIGAEAEGSDTFGGDNQQYTSNATHLKWSVTQSGTDGDPIANLAITSSNTGTDSREDKTVDYEALTNSTTATLRTAKLTGTIQGAGTVTVTVELVASTSGNAANGQEDNRKKTTTVTFAVTDAADVTTTTDPLFSDETGVPDLFDTYDSRDPDSVEWNGLDPLFYNTIDTKSTDYGTAKPKLGKIEKSSLTFEGGTPNTLTVPIIGPVTEVDVYIAQKDAKKLYPASADAIKANIRLTSASIKQYGIPFRVTSYDFTKTVDASGEDADKLKKAQQKAWKKAENVGLTIAFNGANLQYKGFPLTISLKNKNNSSKPAAKAIKLNIGSNFTTPSWGTYEDSTDKTTAAATYDTWEYGKDGTYATGIEYKATGNALTYTDGDETKDETPSHLGYTGTVYSGNTFPVTNATSGATTVYFLSGDNKVYNTTVDYYWRRFTYFKTVEKKDKPEVSTYVIPTTKEAGKLGGEDGKYFFASGDAPYAITLKPDTKKDKEKIGKFMVDPASIDIVQPVYDYLGNVSEHGYVVIHGVPKEKEKESKLAFTLTALNPSTKKKGTAKVTANAKTYPAFDKTNNVKITAAQLENWDYDTNYDPEYYGNEAEDGSITYKRIGVKRVEAGKTPSVKAKAKGSKTISYKLGKYTVDEDGELDSYDDDFNATMLANLKALKLSFDEKKGAVVLLDKSDKATKPTLNETKDAFQSLDIVITAVNNVGYDQAWAYVAITGAKPKMSDKDVTVEGTKKLGDTITFKVLAGKEAAEGLTDGSANVKVYAADSTATSTLKKYGLALVPYDSMDVIVSKEVTVTAGTILPASFNKETDLVSGTVREASEAEGSTEVAGRKYADTGGATILSGDTWAKSADLSLKNYGILQVIDTAALAKVSQDRTANKGVSVNLILENLGSTNKGKIKVVIKDTVDGGDPTKPVVTTTTTTTTTDTTSAAAPKTNGTASLTYNGALPEEAEAEAEAEAEGTVTFGAPRTVADLTAGQQAFLAEKGYTVVAVLPEITADVSDQYKLENIELDEDAPEGATLIWIAFPKNAPASEDDEIVDFYDDAGTPVEGVPASHKIIAVPWLREAVTYEPVIAIEAK